MVYGLHVVEVVVAIGQKGRVGAVDEVIVGGERDRPQAAGQQLHAESFAEGGFP